jgi:hypothetical protein
MRKIKTTKIGKKEYVEVDERIRLFWELHPTWSLNTEMIYNCEENMVVIFKATIMDDTGKIRATGHAREFQADKKSMVNKTSHVENCETSAIGRACGVKGIITEYGLASANEVRNAIEQEKVISKVEGGEQKIVMEVDAVNKNTITAPPEADTVAGASQEWKDQMTGKKAPVPMPTLPSSDDESEEQYLVEFNRRVSTLKNSADAKALADEGRDWSNNWTYKKDTYKTMYACISESFAAFKRSEDNAESASLKGGA